MFSDELRIGTTIHFNNARYEIMGFTAVDGYPAAQLTEKPHWTPELRSRWNDGNYEPANIDVTLKDLRDVKVTNLRLVS